MKDFVKKIAIAIIATRINILAIFSPKKAGLAAFKIFSTPRKGKLNEKNLKVLQKAQWSELACNGEKIQCYEWLGSGEKVLLLHGWESNTARWKNMILSLQKADFHIVAIDAPAHGGSGSDSFQALKYADFINVAVGHFQPKSIVAHSVGGYASLYFLTHFANKVENAVVLGTPSDLAKILNNYAALMGYSQKVRSVLDDFFVENFNIHPKDFSIKTFVNQLTINGLVIHGEDDFICEFEDGKAIHENWKGSEMLITEGIGHGYQDKKVFHAVRNFLLKN